VLLFVMEIIFINDGIKGGRALGLIAAAFLISTVRAAVSMSADVQAHVLPAALNSASCKSSSIV